MKDKLLFGTIGLFVGIVVMQWTMPSGQATVVTPPVGNVVAVESNCVLMIDGSFWALDSTGPDTKGWRRISELPMPVADVQFFGCARIIDKNGDMWEEWNPGQWINYGQPPIAPVATDQSTWGKIKSTFSSKGDKP